MIIGQIFFSLFIMLQFTKILCNTPVKVALWKYSVFLASSSSVASSATDVSAKNYSEELNIDKDTSDSNKYENDETSLNDLKRTLTQRLSEREEIISSIMAATNINEILNLTKTIQLHPDSVKLITLTSKNWIERTAINEISKVKSAHIREKAETNPRLISVQNTRLNPAEDISKFTLLSTKAMVKVIHQLAMNQQRNKVLLDALAVHIVRYNNQLTIQECIDLLYSMVKLNFEHQDLLDKTCSNLQDQLPKCNSFFIIRSVLTSMGLLRCRNTKLLDSCCEWMLLSNEITKSDSVHKFIYALLQTCATVGYKPAQFDVMKEHIDKFSEDVYNLEEWIDVIWSLIVLDEANPVLLTSVLDRVINEKPMLNTGKVLKLLNINSVAKLILENYKGPLIESDAGIFQVKIQVSQEKQKYLDVLSAALNSLLGSLKFYNVHVDTNMGFFTDAECYFDSNLKPVQIDTVSTDTAGLKRVAILLHSYHDYCKGSGTYTGTVLLHLKLLHSKGYEIISIPPDHICLEDKPAKLELYLQQKLGIK